MGNLRVLGEDGKFRSYKGPAPEKVKHKSVEQRMAEHDAQKDESVKEAVKVEIIPLSDDEKQQIKDGLSMPEMKALAKRANIDIKGVKKKVDLQALLLQEDEEEEEVEL